MKTTPRGLPCPRCGKEHEMTWRDGEPIENGLLLICKGCWFEWEMGNKGMKS